MVSFYLFFYVKQWGKNQLLFVLVPRFGLWISQDLVASF